MMTILEYLGWSALGILTLCLVVAVIVISAVTAYHHAKMHMDEMVLTKRITILTERADEMRQLAETTNDYYVEIVKLLETASKLKIKELDPVSKVAPKKPH